MRPLNWTAILITLISGVAWIALNVGTTSGQENRSPTVGAPGRIEQLPLPGTELSARPLDDDRMPIVVRIVEVFPHGDHFRYDIAFQGLEPGEYNLAEYLVRKDGSSTEDLPAIQVEIKSLLPPGQIEPNQLQEGLLPRLGGYRFLVGMATAFWLVILGLLIFIGWGKKPKSVPAPRKKTLADLLRPRLEEALNDEMSSNQLAELERMLFAFWRKQLKLEAVSPERAISEIKRDPKAGPLMRQLESWIHQPTRDTQSNLADLLKPYRKLSADLLDEDDSDWVKQ